MMLRNIQLGGIYRNLLVNTMYNIKGYITTVYRYWNNGLPTDFKIKLVRAQFKGWAFFPIYFQEKITYSNTSQKTPTKS